MQRKVIFSKKAFSLERVVFFEFSQASIFFNFLYFVFFFLYFFEVYSTTQLGTSKMEVLGPKMEILGRPKSIKNRIKNNIKKEHEKVTKTSPKRPYGEEVGGTGVGRAGGRGETLSNYIVTLLRRYYEVILK